MNFKPILTQSSRGGYVFYLDNIFYRISIDTLYGPHGRGETEEEAEKDYYDKIAGHILVDSEGNLVDINANA